MSLENEIYSQPDMLANILDEHWRDVQKIASKLRERKIHNIFLAARGTSDNAGLYAKYLFGWHNGITITLAAPSLFSIYKQAPNIRSSLVVGISQSGQSPDIVDVLKSGHQQGAPTLAITNNPTSPLAKSAEFVLDICAGEERAVAATKTYTAELLTIAMLSIALEVGQEERLAELRKIPALVEKTLRLDESIQQIANHYRCMDHCVVLGRGFNYATAFEWSLKLKELTYTVAEPYSSADFQHGPLAMVADGFPVLAVSPDGQVFDGMFKLLTGLVHQQKADLLVVSNRKEALTLASVSLALPVNLPEWLSPIVSIIPGQLFSLRLAQTKGLDTEKLRNLNKVTKTK